MSRFTGAVVVISLVLMVALRVETLGQLYVYEPAIQTLGIFDLQTEEFSPIGVIDTPQGNVADLEFIGGRLFVLEVTLQGAWILEVDPEDATTISRSPILISGASIPNAKDAIGFDGYRLYVSHWEDGLPTFSSGRIAPVSLGGEVGASSIAPPLPDHDGLGAASMGTLWAADRETANSTCRLIRFSPSTGAILSSREYPIDDTLDGYHELADSGSDLYVSDFVSGRIHVLDRQSLEIKSFVPFPHGRIFVSIAWRGESCSVADVAEPFGLLDLGDINVFISAFLDEAPLADVALPLGVLDLADVSVFATSFLAACQGE